MLFATMVILFLIASSFTFFVGWRLNDKAENIGIITSVTLGVGSLIALFVGAIF